MGLCDSCFMIITIDGDAEAGPAAPSSAPEMMGIQHRLGMIGAAALGCISIPSPGKGLRTAVGVRPQ